MFCRLKRGFTPKIRTFCIVILNQRSFQPLTCLDLPRTPTYALGQGGGPFAHSLLVPRALRAHLGCCCVGIEVGGTLAAGKAPNQVGVSVSVNGVVGAGRAGSCGTETERSPLCGLHNGTLQMPNEQALDVVIEKITVRFKCCFTVWCTHR